MTIDSKIYDSIIISSCLFGSVYMFSTSLQLINESFSRSKNLVMLNTLNSLATVVSGSIFIYGVIKFRNIDRK
jgi:hypothetical protein